MADYFVELTQATGLPFYKKQGPFPTAKGSVIGIRNGFLTAIASEVTDNSKAISFFLRFKQVEDHTRVRDAIAQSETVLQALSEKKWSKSLDKQLTVGKDFLQFRWTYSLRGHSAEKVAALQSALCDAIKTVTTPLEHRCDICESSSTSELLLYNGIPGYYCGSCQEKQRHEQDVAAQEYEARDTNLPRGILFGVVAALAGSIAWGAVAYGLNRIFLWGAVFIGWLIAKAVFAGIGKINRAGQALVLVLTIASVLFGDVIFFVLSVMRSEQVAFSSALLVAVLKNFVEIEKEGGSGLFTIGFALFGAGYVLYTHARKPKFVAVFERLGEPEAQKAKSASASM